MKLVTDSDIQQLLIEALDYNAQIVTLCTSYFGNVESQKNAKKFRDKIVKISKESEKRRKQILGIGNE